MAEFENDDMDFEENATENPNRAGCNIIRHLNAVSNSLNRTLTDIRTNPRRANDLGEELRRSFRGSIEEFQGERIRRNPRTRSTTSTTKDKEDRRFSRDLPVHLFCLQDPSITRTNTDLQMDYLTSLGLGIPFEERRTCHMGRGRQKTRLPLSWTARQLQDFIYSLFEPLRGKKYDLLYSVPGGSLKKFPLEINTPDRMKVYLTDFRRTPGTMFIRPTEFLTVQTPSASQEMPRRTHTASSSRTHTVSSSHTHTASSSHTHSASSLHEEPDALPAQTRSSSPTSDTAGPIQQQARENILPTSSLEIGNPRQQQISLGDYDVISDTNSDNDNEEDDIQLVRPSRQRRRAAEVARTNIREWCGSRLPDRTTNDSSTPMITGNIVDNNGLSLTQLRALQDEEYYDSLRADQRKDQERREQEERIHQEQSELQALEETIRKRIGDLPPEPDTGFTLKLRNGQKRKFKETDSVQILINFVGSQQNATMGFEIFVVGVERKINSWTSSGILKDFGISQSAVVEVNWDIEKPDNSALTLRTYEDLIASTYSQDDDDEGDEDSEENNSDSNASEKNDGDVREIFQTWKINTIDLDNSQKIVVSRLPRSLWEHSLRCFNRTSFKIKNTLQVEFRNECGQDEGGLRREYLEILLREIMKSNYFEEVGENGSEVTMNMVGVVEGTFQTIGKMIATILVQGGSFPPILSHAMVCYGIDGMDAATMDTVADDKKELIRRIKEEDVAKLNGDDPILDALEAAGIRLLISTNTRNSISKALIAFYSRINAKKQALDQFWEGAEVLGLQSLLKKYPDMVKKILCPCCGNRGPLTADQFMAMVNVTQHGERGSNQRQQSEDVAQNFESFVYDCEDGKCQYPGGIVKLQDLLQFITGCSSVPPGGFDTKFTLTFTNSICFPNVSTCTFEIRLPLHLLEYKTFQSVMIEAIISGPGFGIV